MIMKKMMEKEGTERNVCLENETIDDAGRHMNEGEACKDVIEKWEGRKDVGDQQGVNEKRFLDEKMEDIIKKKK